MQIIQTNPSKYRHLSAFLLAIFIVVSEVINQPKSSWLFLHYDFPEDILAIPFDCTLLVSTGASTDLTAEIKINMISFYQLLFYAYIKWKNMTWHKWHLHTHSIRVQWTHTTYFPEDDRCASNQAWCVAYQQQFNCSTVNLVFFFSWSITRCTSLAYIITR